MRLIFYSFLTIMWAYILGASMAHQETFWTIVSTLMVLFNVYRIHGEVSES